MSTPRAAAAAADPGPNDDEDQPMNSPPPAESPPRPRDRALEDVEEGDFGLGAPCTIGEALAERHMSRATFNQWRYHQRGPIFGVPIIVEPGRSPDEFNTQFWRWVELTKRVDVARMRSPTYVGEVKKLRDMRIRFAKLYVDNRVTADIEAARLTHPVGTAQGQPSRDSSHRTADAAIGTTRGGSARARGASRGSPREAPAPQPTNSGTWDIPATSPRSRDSRDAYARDQAIQRGSGESQYGRSPEAARGSAAAPSAWYGYAAPAGLYPAADAQYQLRRDLVDLDDRSREADRWIRSNFDELQRLAPIVARQEEALWTLHRRIEHLERECFDLRQQLGFQQGRRPRSRSRSPASVRSWSAASHQGSRRSGPHPTPPPSPRDEGNEAHVKRRMRLDPAWQIQTIGVATPFHHFEGTDEPRQQLRAVETRDRVLREVLRID